MKKLSTYLFLVLFSFSTPSFGDDISKFQIEGMSIGDSLLDYFSKKQIINNKEDYSYKNNDFYAVKFDNLISSEIYDGGDVYLKTNDENYIIYRIFGAISFHNKNINDWVKNKSSIDIEAVIVGLNKEIQELIKLCKIGPRSAIIDRIQIND